MSQHKGKIRFRFKRKRIQGKRKRLVLPTVMAMILALFAMVFATAGVASATQGGGHDTQKIKVCHATNATNNPYTKNELSYDSSQGPDGGQGDHTHHTGPLWDPSMSNGDNWGDIIPPFEWDGGSFAGLNWTEAGQAIYNNDCKPVEDQPTEIAVPEVPVVDPCGPSNAYYGDVPPGHYTVARNNDGSITLTADKDYTFPDGQETVTLPAPEDSNEPCPPTDQQVTPVTPGFADGCPNELFVPTVEGVQYQLNGENVDGGVIQHLVGSYTVSAVAKEGYVLQGYSGPWTHNFPKETCPTELKTVTPVAPTATTPSCKTTTTITVTPPSQEGVIWDPAGPQQLRLRETKTFTASPAEGYIFTEGARRSWTFTNNFDQPCFGDAPPNNPTVPVDHPQPKPKPTAMPETGWTGSPQSGSPAAMWFLAAGLCAMLSLGSASLGVAVNRRRQDGA